MNYPVHENYELLRPGNVLSRCKNVPLYSPVTAHVALLESSRYVANDELLTVYDPFCGNGTSLVSAMVNFWHRLNYILGSDLNPVAVESTIHNLSLCSANGVRMAPRDAPDRDAFISYIRSFGSRRNLPSFCFQHDATTQIDPDLIQPDSVDLVITDPPFGRASRIHDTSGSEATDEERIRFFKKFLKSVSNVVRKNWIISLVLDKESDFYKDSLPSQEASLLAVHPLGKTSLSTGFQRTLYVLEAR